MDSKILTAERLRDLLHYDPETGVFTWRIGASKRVRAGDIAGFVNGTGYWLIGVDGRKYRAHRLAWLWVYGAWPSKDLDHIDGCRNNNRIFNLREATISENRQNQREARSNNKSSGFLGVTHHKQSNAWMARIVINGKTIHLGLFKEPEITHAAYVSAKRKHHPFCTI